ncbi:MAG TPA: ketosynthase chain-length factor [Mycobacteriales bacterium]|nr:ketosynthase chain-length factor [Mycobacteriales bacterium]
MTAVITGIGVVSPAGVGAAEHWVSTLAGRGAIGPIRRFDASGYPVRLAGEVTGFTAAGHVPGRVAPQTDHWTHLGLAATGLGLADAGADPAELPPYRMAVVTASSSGGVEFGQREIQSLWSRGPAHVTAYQSIAWFYAASTGQISIRYGMKGACGVLVTEQAGGLDVLAQARRLLDDSDADLVVAGGTDAPLSPYALTCQLASGRLSTGTDPASAYLPFDTGAAGYVPGEGGAMFVVESQAGASGRGARTYGRIAGYAATFDPPPGSDRPPTLRRAIEGALADAGAAPDDVDAVFADAAGVSELDRVESVALAEVFGGRPVPVTAPKTMTGRLYAGGAALDVATALLAMRDSVIPPTVGVSVPAMPDHVRLVRDRPRPAPLRTVLVVARGFGGFNAALVLRAPDDP